MLPKSRVKYIQSLGHKKSRDSAGEFVVEGPKVVSECITEAPGRVSALFATGSWLQDNRDLLRNIAADLITEVDETTLLRISHQQTPNQVLALVRQDHSIGPPQTLQGFVLVLDTIQDPGNLGTLIRTADWFGIRHVVCNDGCADVYNPKVVQSSMGSILRVDVSYTDLPSWIAGLGDVPVLATVLGGEDIFSVPMMDRGLILIGNESRGLSPKLITLSTRKITIPRKGSAESLNAAVAGGIVMCMLGKS
jgi:TrmH family RNA methyltransferase